MGRVLPIGPSPSTNHQLVSGYLYYNLYEHLEKNKCRVFSAPFDVRIPGSTEGGAPVTTVVQPDICVVCDPQKLDSAGCLGAPDLVIEILSPSGNKRDLQDKYQLYEEAGVKEYWLVSPQDKTALIYALEGQRFTPSRLMTEGDYATSSVIPGFSVDLATLFAQMI
ncbi:MAG: Uma2 family endonuclease [Chitinophagia bacterium]|nr:Uma2 family endonuclease [Chitinophagia bacterium]